MKRNIVDMCAECDKPIYEEDKILRVTGGKIIHEECAKDMDANDWSELLGFEWETAHTWDGARDCE